MKYNYRQKTISNTPLTLSDHMHEIEAYSTMSLHCMAEIKRLSGLCGTKELDRYIDNSMCDMENSILWIKAARPLLENV